MSEITFRLTAGTNVGCVRSNNEDNFTVNADLSQNNWFIPSDGAKYLPLEAAGALLVVADGMGGMNAGEVASEIAIKTIEKEFSIEAFTSIVD
jgi:protein phosphatase